MHAGIEFYVTTLVVVMSPGPGAMLTITSGLNRGMRVSFITALGGTLGIVPHLLAALLGLAVIFYTSDYAFNMLKLIGVGYLLYMAWMALRERTSLTTEVEIKKSALRIINHALLLNLFNPKLSLFFLAFLPQFIASESSTPTQDMLVLSAIFMLLTLFIFMLYGAFAALMRRRVLEKPRVLCFMNRIFALSFVCLGIKLLISSR
ncbi:LysE family translocator [Pantoea sp. Al-1710]|uniref:LysE family translocator n=1 Tax=Candidatus Pantoea communis TaxID=2608354 RepID=A0ABX0RRP3_9GAMM|nr:LysE family translocator [Pantoea communis]NIG20285.1 LysE family translocator [Pantoea communis]